MQKKTESGLVVLLVHLLVALPSTALEDPIQLQSGLITGIQLDQNIHVYKGIPFAAPPVADLRWRPPQPVTPWPGIRSATEFSAVSPQLIGSNEVSNEDSLYLNVWTPAVENSESLPVMVWLHGGAWSGGSGSMPIFDGTEFARKGVILVTVNYRLGALGFLAHPALSSESEAGVSGNYGILDNLAALQWVQENIGAFGGDPNNVTLFGESAGATNIYLLLTSPLSKGLFHKAIAQSAWVSTTNITHLNSKTEFSDSAESIGAIAVDEYFKDLGAADKASTEFDSADLLARMRNLPAEEAIKIPINTTVAVDGWIFPDLPSDVLRDGRAHSVPIIAGINSGEGTFFVRGEYETASQQRDAKTELFGEHASELLEYYGARSKGDIRRAEIEHITDEWFSRPAREMVRSVASAGNSAFLYYFTRNRFTPAALTPHVAEVPYVFKFLNPDFSDTKDLELADTINNYWVEFAKNGTPNNNVLPPWPAYNTETENYQHLDVDISFGSFLHKDKLDALEKYISRKSLSERAGLSGSWTIKVNIMGEYAGDSKLSLQANTDGELEGIYSGQLLNGAFQGSHNNEKFEFTFDSDIGMSLTFKGVLLESGQIEGTLGSGGQNFGSFKSEIEE